MDAELGQFLYHALDDRSREVPAGLRFDVDGPTPTKEQLSWAVSRGLRLSLTSGGDCDVSILEPLVDRLRSLTLGLIGTVRGLKVLERVERLEQIQFNTVFETDQPVDLSGLQSLQRVANLVPESMESVLHNPYFTSLDLTAPLRRGTRGLPAKLRSLSLRSWSGLGGLPPNFVDYGALEVFSLAPPRRFDLAALLQVPKLQQLWVAGCGQFTNLGALRELKHLRRLYLEGATSEDWDALLELDMVDVGVAVESAASPRFHQEASRRGWRVVDVAGERDAKLAPFQLLGPDETGGSFRVLCDDFIAVDELIVAAVGEDSADRVGAGGDLVEGLLRIAIEDDPAFAGAPIVYDSEGGLMAVSFPSKKLADRAIQKTRTLLKRRPALRAALDRITPHEQDRP